MEMKVGSLSPLLKLLGIIAYVAPFSSSADRPQTCESAIYCYGDLLHAVQMARLYIDSKTFVDLRMVKSENDTVVDFKAMVNNNPNYTREDLKKFVDDHFHDGNELVQWTPDDFVAEPLILQNIRDPNYKQFAKDLIAIWPTLARKVTDEVGRSPDKFSIHNLPNGFIIPGGRFKEIYYWDSYWIIEGLLISGMNETARGMIENLMHLVKILGHVPNGSRKYYNQRSQPPLLTAMAEKYVAFTGDTEWLRNHVDILEKELKFWLENRIVTVHKNGRTYSLLRYYAPSSGPRPESYREDFELANKTKSNISSVQELYADLKSAAESGWDFSARWFVASDGSNHGNLGDIKTRRIIPVELNAIFAAALNTIARINIQLRRIKQAKEWWAWSIQWKDAIEVFFWDEKDGIWYDYDIELQKHRRYFYPSNVSPLWMKVVDVENLHLHAPRVIQYLKNSPAMNFPGGVPASVDHTGEQWDHPNAWPPLQSMIILALRNTGLEEGKKMSIELAQTWVRANYIGFKKHKAMFEKYDAEIPGEYGGGGEYNTQLGFGWSNGVILELLNIYGHDLKWNQS